MFIRGIKDYSGFSKDYMRFCIRAIFVFFLSSFQNQFESIVDVDGNVVTHNNNSYTLHILSHNSKSQCIAIGILMIAIIIAFVYISMIEF